MIVQTVFLWVATGLVTGWVTRTAMRSQREYGVLGDITSGCLGAVVGGWLLHRLHVLTPADAAGHVLVSFIGAVTLLAAVRLLRRLSAAVRRVAPAAFTNGVADLETQMRRATEFERGILAKFLGRRHVSSDINQTFESQLTFGERLADKVAAVGGSWVFIGIFFVVLVCWMAMNEQMARPFDPYPFILLNLLLSCLAAVQAPIIMMSQNRQAAKDRLDARNDFEVNLRAEMEIMALHEKLDTLRSRDLMDMLQLLEKQMQRIGELERTLAGERSR
ncbi:MAG: DUF1003 domain-containing protein [Gammaproteobacteria bacterium]